MIDRQRIFTHLESIAHEFGPAPPLARVGGLQAHEAKGVDGLR